MGCMPTFLVIISCVVLLGFVRENWFVVCFTEPVVYPVPPQYHGYDTAK